MESESQIMVDGEPIGVSGTMTPSLWAKAAPTLYRAFAGMSLGAVISMGAGITATSLLLLFAPSISGALHLGMWKWLTALALFIGIVLIWGPTSFLKNIKKSTATKIDYRFGTEFIRAERGSEWAEFSWMSCRSWTRLHDAIAIQLNRRDLVFVDRTFVADESDWNRLQSLVFDLANSDHSSQPFLPPSVPPSGWDDSGRVIAHGVRDATSYVRARRLLSGQPAMSPVVYGALVFMLLLLAWRVGIKGTRASNWFAILACAGVFFPLARWFVVRAAGNGTVWHHWVWYAVSQDGLEWHWPDRRGFDKWDQFKSYASGGEVIALCGVRGASHVLERRMLVSDQLWNSVVDLVRQKLPRYEPPRKSTRLFL